MTFTTLLLFCVVALVAIATSNVRILVEHVTKTHHRKCWSPLPLATSEFWFSVLKWVLPPIWHGSVFTSGVKRRV